MGKDGEVPAIGKLLLLPQNMGIAKKQEQDFPGGTVDGNLPDNAGDTGSIPGPGRFYTQRNQV